MVGCLAGKQPKGFSEIVLITHQLDYGSFFVVFLQSEDKKFVPVKEIEGPVQALVHIVKSSYFPRSYADILIAFFTK